MSQRRNRKRQTRQPRPTPTPPVDVTLARNPLAVEQLGVVTIEHLGATLTSNVADVDFARYAWELRMLSSERAAQDRKIQAAQNLLVLLFGEAQLDQLVLARGGQVLTLASASELLAKWTRAVQGASPGESPAS